MPQSQHDSRWVVGLMSGMSMDGVDLALVCISGDDDRPDVHLKAHATDAYSDALRKRMQAARGGTVEAAAELDFELARYWSKSVLSFLTKCDVAPSDVDAIGSHGQTLYHRPKSPSTSACTLQIGRGDVMALETNIVTVSDFRPRDIAMGGEGAPLIPLVDWLLFRSSERIVGCVNLGSIANITALQDNASDVVGFDIGPANALVDAYAQRLPGAPRFDRDGEVARSANVNDDLLLSMFSMRAKWLAQAPPKSAGYDTFGPALLAALDERHGDVDGRAAVATATEFTAQVFRDGLERHVLTRAPALSRLLFSGGGARNSFLMERIRTCLGTSLGTATIEVDVLQDDWIDAKEAIGFALLADRRLRGLPGNLPSTTGARRSVALGTIHRP